MSLYRRSDSGPWWYLFRVHRHRYRGSTGTTDRRRAREVERRIRAEIEAQSPAPAPGDRLTLALLGGLDAERARAAGATPTGVASIQSHWANLTALLGASTEPSAVTYELVEAYVGARRAETFLGEHTRGQTILREIQALKRGLKIALRRRAIQALPEEWPTIRRDPPKESQRGHLHEVDVLQRWLAALPEEPRAQALVALLTGLRATELRRLTWAWVEEPPRGIDAPALLRLPAAGTKSKRERLVALPGPALEALRTIHDRVDKEGEKPLPLLAVQWRKRFVAACKAIEYPRMITLRDLRHCHGTLGLQLTGDAAATQAALGHTQLAVTQRYQSSTIARAASVGMAVASALAGPNGHTREATGTQEVAPAGGLEPPTPGLTALIRACREGLGLDDEQIAVVLRTVADLLEQGEAATPGGHRRQA